jgi:hypothetical protein
MTPTDVERMELERRIKTRKGYAEEARKHAVSCYWLRAQTWVAIPILELGSVGKGPPHLPHDGRAGHLRGA